MNIINDNSNQTPSEFFIFVNMRNQITKSNIEKTKCISSAAFLQYIEKADVSFSEKYLKGIISAYSPGQNNADFVKKYKEGTLDYLPFNYNFNCDVNFVSMFTNSVTSSYNTEYNCEVFRRLNYQLYPSRLSSCYAFGDFESCIEVNRLYNWDLNSVRKFKLIPHEDNRVAKVNMEIVSLTRTANNISVLSIETIQKIWDSYWAGKGNISLELPMLDGNMATIESGVLWEYLVEGILTLVD
jgi:hypothetical protein